MVRVGAEYWRGALRSILSFEVQVQGVADPVGPVFGYEPSETVHAQGGISRANARV